MSSETPSRIVVLLATLSVLAPSVGLAAPPDGEAEAAPAEGEAAPAEDEAAPTEANEDEGSAEEPSEADRAESSEQGQAREESSTDEDSTDASPAETDMSDPSARFQVAAEAYELGKYAEAIEGFESLYEDTKEPSLLYNLGQANWRWFNVDPDPTHLRVAKQMFDNYDRAMNGKEGYDRREVERNVKAIDAQLRALAAQQSATDLQPSGPDPELLEYDRQRRVNTGMTISGVTLTVLGTAGLVAGVVGLGIRRGAGFALDNTGGGGDGQPNFLSEAEDDQLRQDYLTGGQIGFGGLISAAVLLPPGIALTTVGTIRNKRLVEEQEREYEVSIQPGGLKLSF